MYLELYKMTGNDIKEALKRLEESIVRNTGSKKEFYLVNRDTLKRMEMIEVIRNELDDCICEAYPEEPDIVILNLFY